MCEGNCMLNKEVKLCNCLVIAMLNPAPVYSMVEFWVVRGSGS